MEVKYTMMRILLLFSMAALLIVSFAAFAASDDSPAQYCKQAAPPQFFNACVVCAAHGSLGPYGDGRICICKTIMSEFGGPPPFKSFGECMQALKQGPS